MSCRTYVLMLGSPVLELTDVRLDLMRSARHSVRSIRPWRRGRADLRRRVREEVVAWPSLDPQATIRIEVLAYAAGVIDSDGSITISRETYAMRVLKTAGQPTFSERITIRQIEPEAVDLLHQQFGGCRSVIISKSKKRRRQPLQSLVIADRKAGRVLAAVLPYLRIKRQQAELCLEMRRLKEESRKARFAYGRGHRGGGKRPEQITEAMEQIRAEILKLNRVDGRAQRRNPSLGHVRRV